LSSVTVIKMAVRIDHETDLTTPRYLDRAVAVEQSRLI
jgi:hypothetical protein